MKFLQIFRKNKTRQDFTDIEGYYDIKDIVRRVLDSDDNYNLLFTGPPASAKTLFLLGINEREDDCIYFDCSNTTNKTLQVLEEERPKIILLDEIDNMPCAWQGKLLNLLESGRVKVDQKNLQLDFELEGLKVFATSNEISKLSKPLQSRYRGLHLLKYTKEQFLNVAAAVCPKLSEEIAMFIGEKVWESKGDVRDIIFIAKLVRERTIGLTAITSPPQFHQMVFPWQVQKVKTHCQDKELWSYTWPPQKEKLELCH
jgi:holliday junction DNA helicase RuvB